MFRALRWKKEPPEKRQRPEAELQGACLIENYPDQVSRKLRILRERDGCLSLRSAFASI